MIHFNLFLKRSQKTLLKHSERSINSEGPTHEKLLLPKSNRILGKWSCLSGEISYRYNSSLSHSYWSSLVSHVASLSPAHCFHWKLLDINSIVGDLTASCSVSDNLDSSSILFRNVILVSWITVIKYRKDKRLHELQLDCLTLARPSARWLELVSSVLPSRTDSDGDAELMRPNTEEPIGIQVEMAVSK